MKVITTSTTTISVIIIIITTITIVIGNAIRIGTSITFTNSIVGLIVLRRSGMGNKELNTNLELTPDEGELLLTALLPWSDQRPSNDW